MAPPPAPPGKQPEPPPLSRRAAAGLLAWAVAVTFAYLAVRELGVRLPA